ncbi:reverse transcriptase domain-containing protein [Tanacetum coccineum]
MPRECLKIFESKYKVRQSRKQSCCSINEYKLFHPSKSHLTVAELKDIAAAAISYNQANYGYRPSDAQISIRLSGFPPLLLPDLELFLDNGWPLLNYRKTRERPTPVVQIQTRNPNPEPNVAPVVTPVPKASIPFPSRRNDERRKEKANDQIEKFYEIFRDLSFEISFTDALMLMPKFASTLKTLIGNKEKLSELARTPLNENCSAVILNKLPKKLGDPGRFLIPCEFTGITTCNALADLGASINLMPYSVWKDLALPELTPTCMTLELADRSITEPIGIAKDVRLMVGKFQFPADFVMFMKERLPFVLAMEANKTFNLDQTSKYTADYDHMTANKIDVIEMACDEYSNGFPGFSKRDHEWHSLPYFEPIVFYCFSKSHSLTEQ